MFVTTTRCSIFWQLPDYKVWHYFWQELIPKVGKKRQNLRKYAFKSYAIFPGIPPFLSRETGILKSAFSREFPGREIPGLGTKCNSYIFFANDCKSMVIFTFDDLLSIQQNKSGFTYNKRLSWTGRYIQYMIFYATLLEAMQADYKHKFGTFLFFVIHFFTTHT